jgi:hypothetical protein
MAVEPVPQTALPTLQGQGLMKVVTPGAVTNFQDALDKKRAAEQDAMNAAGESEVEQNIASYITKQYEQFKRHRTSANGWDERLLAALRAFNGQYDATKLAEIKKFGGSEVYARIVAMKCRGASSLLRDVYLGPDLPWGIKPPADPDIPQEVIQSIQVLIQAEVAGMQEMGQPPDVTKIQDRTEQLLIAAREAAKRKAAKQATIAQEKIQEILVKGGFYKAMAEFIQDLPLFPFAVMKGAVVRIEPVVTWEGNQPIVREDPLLYWQRVSPFDIWWTPGAADIAGADVIERTRLSRADLNDLLDLPGYNVPNVRKVLEEYGSGGLSDNWDSTDSERAQMESRESPVMNESGLITCLEFHGNIQGKLLLEYGMTPEEIPDELRDYFVQAWLIGRYVIKVQMSPSPRKRHPYYITSFEKMPGTPVGNAVPDLISDLSDVANATLRALVNNLSIASGPQVVVNHDRLGPGEDGQQLYPWKRWAVTSDPLGNNTEMPVSFFQPTSDAQNLLAVYNAFSSIADDISAIPRYVTGGNAGGAGRTASGLSMLMSNSAKILQTVAANVDRDVVELVMENLLDMVMLTDDSGLLNGQEKAEVRGVTVAIQKETQRQRQLEFLTATANPIDMSIIGPRGRAAILRAVSKDLGIESGQIVPSDEDLEKQQQQAAAQAQMAGQPGFAAPGQQEDAAQAQGAQPGPTANNAQGPQTNTVQGGPQ